MDSNGSQPVWSPRTRGWPPGDALLVADVLMVPAHAGVAPTCCPGTCRTRYGPRARGGGPRSCVEREPVPQWSPRTRGWPRLAAVGEPTGHMVPAHAGVAPSPARTGRAGSYGPRARGGGPWPGTPQSSHPQWSPRTRGWPRAAGELGHVQPMVPAHAGVAPRSPAGSARTAHGPRARGGGPWSTEPAQICSAWSPRTRGWPLRPHPPHRSPPMVPAHAGVALTRSTTTPRALDGPRARGGGPVVETTAMPDNKWSPRARAAPLLLRVPPSCSAGACGRRVGNWQVNRPADGSSVVGARHTAPACGGAAHAVAVSQACRRVPGHDRRS